MTEEEPKIPNELARERISKILGKKTYKGKGREHDRLALILEWIRTDPTEHPHVLKWAEAKGIHKVTLSSWGGAQRWHQLRDEVRSEAYARAIEKSPNAIAKDLEDLFEVRSEATRLAKRLIERAHLDLDKEEKPSGDPAKDKLEDEERRKERSKSTFNTGLLERITESLDKLAEADAKIKGKAPGQAPPPGGTTINLYPALLDSLKKRDHEHGVIEGEARRSE